MSKKPLNVGDVISSSEFAFGHRDFRREDEETAIIVGGVEKDYIVTESYDEETRVRHAAQTGKTLPKWHDVNYGAYDPSRGTAKFVVERAEMEGGGHGGGLNDQIDYPDALYVTARRLGPHWEYDPNGEVIKFTYQSVCYNNSIVRVTVHKRMKLQFTK
jgi:hypothetical protein